MLGGRTLCQSDNKPDVYKPDLSFMDDFNPENSKREQRKNKEKLAVMNKEKKLYDKNGLLISNQKDLCDCMEEACPGCHFTDPISRRHDMARYVDIDFGS